MRTILDADLGRKTVRMADPTEDPMDRPIAMESTLHRQLKDRYGPDLGGRAEVRVGDYRADAIDPEGRLIEVQAGPLGALKGKLARLLDAHEVRVVKPIVIERRIVRRDRADGPDRSSRRSPKRGELLDVFDELGRTGPRLPAPEPRDRGRRRRDRRGPRRPEAGATGWSTAGSSR